MSLCVEPVRGLRNALLFGYFDAITHFSHNISTTKTPVLPGERKEEKKERRAAKTARYVFWNLIWAPRLLRVAECGMCALVGLNVRRLYIRRAITVHTHLSKVLSAHVNSAWRAVYTYIQAWLCARSVCGTRPRLCHTSQSIPEIVLHTRGDEGQQLAICA